MKGKTNKSTLDDGKPERWQAGKVRGKNFGLMRTKEIKGFIWEKR
jgi:hypothetical protein